MKKLLLTLSVLASLQAAASEEPIYYCRAVFKEKSTFEVKDFIFECDNYGADATVQSKSKRFEIIGFSEESCTPMLMIYDNRTKTGTTMIATEDGFKAFDSRLVVVSMIPVTKKEQLLNPRGAQDAAYVGCSTDKSLLDELVEQD